MLEYIREERTLTECIEGQMGGERRGRGREEETGNRGRTGRRARDKTYWPGAELAAEAGCRAGLCGPQGADGQRGGRRGNRDKFCQNWVHTPGATELGWPWERVRERTMGEMCCYLYHFST